MRMNADLTPAAPGTSQRLGWSVVAPLLASALLFGCVVSPHSLVVTPHFPDEHAPGFDTRVITAEACSFYLFAVIPAGGNASVATVMRRLDAAARGMRMTRVSLDVQTAYFLVGSSVCTIATGTFVAPVPRSGLRAPRASGDRPRSGAPPEPRPEEVAPEPELAGGSTSGVVHLTLGPTADLAAAIRVLAGWVGRPVEVVNVSGLQVRGELTSVRGFDVTLRPAADHPDLGESWRVSVAEIQSIRLIEPAAPISD